MLGVYLLDSNGTTISSLTQWDYNITLVIEESGFTTAPMFHFAHEDSENTLPVQSILEDGKISVEVPNILLQEAKKILVYIFVKSGESGRTVEIIRIPVRDKAKPLDYEYSDNLEIVNLYELQEELKATIVEAQSASTLAYEAADNANSKASDAQTAADAANTARDQATTATSQANTARDQANAAAQQARAAADEINKILDDIGSAVASTMLDDTAPSLEKTYSSQYIEEQFRWEAATDEEILAILEEN